MKTSAHSRTGQSGRPRKRAPSAKRATQGAAGTRAAAAVEVRVAAIRLLETLLDGGGSLTRLLPVAQAALPMADRALLQSYAYGLARWSGQLDTVLAVLLERPLKARDRDLQLLLQLGLFQLLHTRTPTHAAVDSSVATAVALDKPWARGLVNGVLRNADRRRGELLATLDPRAELSHPDWLLDALQDDWPEDWRAIARANNERAPMVLRVNLAKNDREHYQRLLAAADLIAKPLGDAPAALVLDAAVPVESLPGFDDGLVSVQDGAAQLAIGLLINAVAPGARLLDACAAPGGKTAQAIESGHFGDIIALDHDAGRLARAADTLARLELSERAELLVADAGDPDAWWNGQAFEAILIDAPCTATGVIRRHPDIKLLRRARDVDALVDEQRRLLETLWPLLAPGGAMLYATCSTLRAEGERQIHAFLDRHADATRVHEERLLPGAARDGFYHALLVRQ